MALKLSILLEAVDRLSAPLERAQARINAIAAPIREIASATGRLGRAGGADRIVGAFTRIAAGARQAAGAVLQMTGSVAALTGIGAGIGIAAVGRSAIAGASEMERFAITLTQVEGSAAAAQRALAWVSDFATRTPYELAEVTRAFVDIRNLGLDPTRGALQAAGDAASIMGTRFEEAVTALSAALRGEMDPLERFGVFARTEGETIVMEWEHQGRRMRAVVDKNNREMIARFVQMAWAQKFGGGMDQLSRSWAGMMSNLADHWSRFQGMVMRAGVFDWLKARLERLLATLDRLAADGTLQRWADQVAAATLHVLNALERLLTEGDVWGRIGAAVTRAGQALDWMRRTLEPLTGPLDALDVALAALAVVAGGPLLGGLAALAGGFTALAAALIATPVGLGIAAIGALAALGVTLYRNWDGVLAGFQAMWEALPGPVQTAINLLATPIRGLVRLAVLLRDGWREAGDALERLVGLLPRLGGEGNGRLTAPDAQQLRRDNWRNRGGALGPRLEDIPGLFGGAEPLGYAPAPGGQLDVGGTLRIRLEDGRISATGRLNQPGVRVDVDQGLLVR